MARINKEIVYSTGLAKDDQLIHGKVIIKTDVDESRAAVNNETAILEITNRAGDRMGLELNAVRTLISALRQTLLATDYRERGSLAYYELMGLQDAAKEDLV